MAYPKLNGQPKFSQVETEDDQLKELQYKRQKHDHENILKSLQTDNDYLEKK